MKILALLALCLASAANSPITKTMSFITLYGIACFLAGMLFAGLILYIILCVLIAIERRRIEREGPLEFLNSPRYGP